MTPDVTCQEPKPFEIQVEDDNPKSTTSLADAFFNGGRGLVDLSISKSEHSPLKCHRRRLSHQTTTTTTSTTTTSSNKPLSARSPGGLLGTSEHGDTRTPRRHNSSNSLNKRLSQSADRRKSANDAFQVGIIFDKASSANDDVGPVISSSRRRSGLPPGHRRPRISKTETEGEIRQTPKLGEQDRIIASSEPGMKKDETPRPSSVDRIKKNSNVDGVDRTESPVKQLRTKDGERGRTTRRTTETDAIVEDNPMRSISCDHQERSHDDSPLKNVVNHVRRTSRSIERRRHRRPLEGRPPVSGTPMTPTGGRRSSTTHLSGERTIGTGRTMRHHEVSHTAWTNNLKRMRKGSLARGDTTPPPEMTSIASEESTDEMLLPQSTTTTTTTQSGEVEKSSHSKSSHSKSSHSQDVPAYTGGTKLVLPAIPRLRRRIDNSYAVPLPKTVDDKKHHPKYDNDATTTFETQNLTQRTISKSGDAAESMIADDNFVFKSRSISLSQSLERSLGDDREKFKAIPIIPQGHDEDSVFDTAFLSTRKNACFDNPSTTQQEPRSSYVQESPVETALASTMLQFGDRQLDSKPHSLPSSPTTGRNNKSNTCFSDKGECFDLPFGSLTDDADSNPLDLPEKFDADDLRDRNHSSDFGTKDRQSCRLEIPSQGLPVRIFDDYIEFDPASSEVHHIGGATGCLARDTVVTVDKANKPGITKNLPTKHAMHPTLCREGSITSPSQAPTSAVPFSEKEGMDDIDEQFVNIDLNTTSHGGKKKGLKKLLGKSKKFNKLIDGGDSVCLEDLPSSNEKSLETRQILTSVKPVQLPLDKALNNKVKDDSIQTPNNSDVLSFSMDLAVPESQQQRGPSQLLSQPSRRKFFIKKPKKFQTFDDSGLISYSMEDTNFNQQPWDDMVVNNQSAEAFSRTFSDSANGRESNKFGADFDLDAHLNSNERKESPIELLRKQPMDFDDRGSPLPNRMDQRNNMISATSGRISWEAVMEVDVRKLDHLLSQSTNCQSSDLPDPSICPHFNGLVEDHVGKLESLLCQSEHPQASQLAEPSICEPSGGAEKSRETSNNTTSILTIVVETNQADEVDEESSAENGGEDIDNLSTASLSSDRDVLNPLPSDRNGSFHEGDFNMTALDRYQSDVSIFDQSFMTLEEQQQFLQLNLPGMDGYKSSSSLAVVEHTFDGLNVQIREDVD